MRARSLMLPSLAGLSLLSFAVVSSVTPARAQGQAADDVARLDVKGADVREAIRDLFKGTGRSFTIDPQVQGPVTLSLRNVAFDVALGNIARQVDATYRVEGGVYAIVPHGQGGFGGGGGLGGGGFGGGQGGFGGGGFQVGPVEAEPPVMVIDGPFIFVLRRGVLYKVQKGDMNLLGQVALGPDGPGRPGGGRGLGTPNGGGLGGGRPGQP